MLKQSGKPGKNRIGDSTEQIAGWQGVRQGFDGFALLIDSAAAIPDQNHSGFSVLSFFVLRTAANLYFKQVRQPMLANAKGRSVVSGSLC